MNAWKRLWATLSAIGCSELISIGGSLTLQTLKTYFTPALASAAFKLLLLPATGTLFLHLFGVEGIYYAVGLIFFALPTSPAIYVLSSQLGSLNWRQPQSCSLRYYPFVP
jgi:predicted permease